MIPRPGNLVWRSLADCSRWLGAGLALPAVPARRAGHWVERRYGAHRDRRSRPRRRAASPSPAPWWSAVPAAAPSARATAASTWRSRDCPWGTTVEVTAAATVGGRTATSSVRVTPAAPTWGVGSMFLQAGAGCSPSWLPTFGGAAGGRRRRLRPRGVRRRQRPGALRGRRLHDARAAWRRAASRSGTARAGRRSGSGMDGARLRPRGVRRRQRPGALRRRRLHDRGRRGGEPHREVGRRELVGARAAG